MAEGEGGGGRGGRKLEKTFQQRNREGRIAHLIKARVESRHGLEEVEKREREERKRVREGEGW